MTHRADFTQLHALAVLSQEISFTRAAVRLGISPSALSKMIKHLEAEIGTRLVNRTTRSMALTEAGRSLLKRAEPALSELRAAIDDAASVSDDPVGSVRINMPLLAGELVFAPALARLTDAHPRVRLEIIADDGFGDIVAQGCDAGVRLATTVPQDMIGVQVSAPQPTAIVASPEYLARHGTPNNPDDLLDHVCLSYRWSGSKAVFRWSLDDGTMTREIVTGERFVFNDTSLIVLAARGGAGLAMILRDRVADQLADGSLIAVMERWCPEWPPYVLYYPGRRHTSPALRAVADFFRWRNIV